MQKIIEGTRKEKIGQELFHAFECSTEHLTEGHKPGYSFCSVLSKIPGSSQYHYIRAIFEGHTTITEVVQEVKNKAQQMQII